MNDCGTLLDGYKAVISGLRRVPITLGICSVVKPGPTRVQHCSYALQTEIQLLSPSRRFIKGIKQRPGCCQCPQVMANTFQVEKKNHLSLCTAPMITQSQPKQVRIINGNRQLETQVKDRRHPCLSSFPFAHDAKVSRDHLTVLLARCSLVGKALTVMSSGCMWAQLTWEVRLQTPSLWVKLLWWHFL